MLNYLIGMMAITAFAIAGVLAVARKDLDLIGVVIMGVITALGGGTLRDLLLGVDVFWMIDFNYGWVAILASLAAFYLAHHFRRVTFWLWILYIDAFGIALFGVQSIDKALIHGYTAPVAVMMATITGIGGGLIRDVLARRENLLNGREIYATAILTGGAMYVMLVDWLGHTLIGSVCAIAFIFIFRALAIKLHWVMPTMLTFRE